MARTPTGGAPRTQARAGAAQAAAATSVVPSTPASSAIPKPAVYPPVPSSLARAQVPPDGTTALTLSELMAPEGGREGSPKTAARVYPPLPTEDVPPAPSTSLRGAGSATSSFGRSSALAASSLGLGMTGTSFTPGGPLLPSKEWTMEEVLAAVKAEPRKDVAEGELAPKACSYVESPSAITCAGKLPMDVKVALTPYVTWLRGKAEEPAEGFEPLAEVLLTHSSPLHQIMLPTSSWRSVPDLARLCPPTAFLLTATKLYDALFDLQGNPVTPLVLEPAQALKVTRLVTALSALGGKSTGSAGGSRYKHAPRLPLTVMCKVLSLKTKEAKSSLGADASKSRLIGNGTLSVVGGSRLAFTLMGGPGAVPATPAHATGALAIGSALRPSTGAPPAMFAAALGTPAGKGAAQAVAVPAAAAATPVSAGVGPKAGAKRLSGGTGLPLPPAFPGMAASNTSGTPMGLTRPLGTIDTSSRANAIPSLPAGSSASGSGSGALECDSPGRTGSTGTGSTGGSPVSVTF